MNIRTRMESGVGYRRPLDQIAGVVAIGGLSGAAAVHAAWAAGSAFPARDRTALAELVVGTSVFPSTRATLGVTGLLAAAVGTVVAGRSAAGHNRWVRRANAALASVLAARGAGGLVATGFGLGSATPMFRRWDLRLYSPLCLALAGAVWLARGSER